jgi:ADP-heptose:LPS heptosyltransferase
VPTHEPDAPANLNLRRRPVLGLPALVAAPFLRLLLLPVRRYGKTEAPLWVFSSYMVGDLFMALPALKRLAAATDLRVLCRPDCVGILRGEGLEPVPFENRFLLRRSPAAFVHTLRAAWHLRGMRKNNGLDFDADPRSALWLQLAGCARVESYRRPFGILFDATFELPSDAVHQADRDQAVVDHFLRTHRGDLSAPQTITGAVARASTPGVALGALSAPLTQTSAPWILSVWTRKAAKNWPLEHWNALMERLIEDRVPFAVLHAPDGDSAYQLFRARWAGLIAFIEGDLDLVAEHVKESAGVVATDNFLGHMAGYYGKPVLWINISSPAAQVEPRGPHTVRVGALHPESPEIPSVESVAEAFRGIRLHPKAVNPQDED